MAIDKEIASKMKMALADNITKEIKDISMHNKAQMNFITTIDRIPTDVVNEPNNTDVKTHIESVSNATLKIVYDTK